MKRAALLSGFVLALTLGVLLSYLHFDYRRDQNTQEQRFNPYLKQVSSAIRDRLKSIETILNGVAGLFDASVVVNRIEFRHYVERLNLETDRPALNRIAYLKIIKSSELSAHTRAVQAEGFPQYSVRPPGPRDRYALVAYIEPTSQTELASIHGFDSLSDPIRAKAIQSAVETGLSIVAPPVRTLIDTTEAAPASFTMYNPIYRKNQPKGNAQERWAALSGVAVGSIGVGVLVQGLLFPDDLPVSIQIYEDIARTPASLLFDNREPQDLQDALSNGKPLSQSTTVQLHGASLTLQVTGKADFATLWLSGTRQGVLILGSIVCVVLSFLTWVLMRRNADRVLADEMTQEIQSQATAMQLAQRDLQETMQLNKDILDNVMNGVISIDEKGLIQSFNQAAEQTFGYTAQEVMGQNVKLLMPEPYHSEHDGYLSEYKTSGVAKIIGIGREVIGKRKDGTTFPMDLAISRSIRHGQPLFIGSVRDITERKRTDAALRASLAEKEVLMQEIHHRVKNNLQVVSALINMQQRRLAEGESRDALRECQNRIRSIALIHEQLYRTKDFTHVPFADYARSLATNIFQATGLSHSNIKLTVDIDAIALAVDQAVPCGLITNELITNALKHGIKAEEQGTLHVALKTAPEGRVVLSVSDSGRGLPKGFDPRATKSLGFQIVTTLAEQLHATLEISPQERGACISLTFKLRS